MKIISSLNIHGDVPVKRVIQEQVPIIIKVKPKANLLKYNTQVVAN